MKNKLILIIGLLVIAIAVAAVIILMPKAETVTISFDTDGASVIEPITIKKGESITLPTISRGGYVFDGWYLDDEKVSNLTKYDKDVTLKARWNASNVKRS